jgi:hypothetical protein
MWLQVQQAAASAEAVAAHFAQMEVQIAGVRRRLRRTPAIYVVPIPSPYLTWGEGVRPGGVCNIRVDSWKSKSWRSPSGRGGRRCGTLAGVQCLVSAAPPDTGRCSAIRTHAKSSGGGLRSPREGRLPSIHPPPQQPLLSHPPPHAHSLSHTPSHMHTHQPPAQRLHVRHVAVCQRDQRDLVPAEQREQRRRHPCGRAVLPRFPPALVFPLTHRGALCETRSCTL